MNKKLIIAVIIITLLLSACSNTKTIEQNPVETPTNTYEVINTPEVTEKPEATATEEPVNTPKPASHTKIVGAGIENTNLDEFSSNITKFDWVNNNFYIMNTQDRKIEQIDGRYKCSVEYAIYTEAKLGTEVAPDASLIIMENHDIMSGALNNLYIIASSSNSTDMEIIDHIVKQFIVDRLGDSVSESIKNVTPESWDNKLIENSKYTVSCKFSYQDCDPECELTPPERFELPTIERYAVNYTNSYSILVDYTNEEDKLIEYENIDLSLDGMSYIDSGRLLNTKLGLLGSLYNINSLTNKKVLIRLSEYTDRISSNSIKTERQNYVDWNAIELNGKMTYEKNQIDIKYSVEYLSSGTNEHTYELSGFKGNSRRDCLDFIVYIVKEFINEDISLDEYKDESEFKYTMETTSGNILKIASEITDYNDGIYRLTVTISVDYQDV